MASASDRDDDISGYALGVTREGSDWNLVRLDDSALRGLADASRQVRSLRSEGPSFGMINVDDEFFVLLRPTPGGLRLMLSDATAAVYDDLAADILDELDVDVPDLSDEELDTTEPWGEGDMALLSDLGLPEGVLEIIVGETDLYADEQLESVAERMGFLGEYERLVGQ